LQRVKRKASLLLIVLVAAFPGKGYAQSGCTDIQAINYDSAATVNDGSCVYPVTNYSPVLVTNLASQVNESSGLVQFNGELWTHEDSGNPNVIHKINPADGSVLRTVVVANAVNIDWESVTVADGYLYIGDFGNNSGNRTDLVVLKISTDDIVNAANDTVQAAFIRFSYSDQVDFTPSSNNTNYDGEAFFYFNDSLHLFSKNWVNLQTKHYVLPADTGTYTAQLIDSFNTDGLVTDAAVNDSGNMVLLGYKDMGGNVWACFAWLMFDYTDIHHCFSGNKRRIELGYAFTLGQTEGITLFNDNTGYISSEKVQIIPPKLHSFDFSAYLMNLSTNSDAAYSQEAGITVYPVNFIDELIIHNRLDVKAQYEIRDSAGKMVMKGRLSPGINRLDTGRVAAGIYFFIAGSSRIRLFK
jgi:hypothetical protein